MPATYEPIATTTLSSAASTITFSSIPATYTDLRIVLVGSTTTSTTGAFVGLYPNSDTASNYSRTQLLGDGTSATSARTTNASYAPIGALPGTTAVTPGFSSADIFSYAGSTYKTWLWQVNKDSNGGSGSQVYRGVALWRSTAAISSILLQFPGGQQFASGTIATVYGVKSA